MNDPSALHCPLLPLLFGLTRLVKAVKAVKAVKVAMRCAIPAQEGTRLAAGDVSADDTWLPPLLGIVVAFGATWRDAIPADEALKLDGQLLRRLRRSQLHRLSRSQPRAGSPLRILAREAKGDLCFPAFQSGVGCAISS